MRIFGILLTILISYPSFADELIIDGSSTVYPIVDKLLDTYKVNSKISVKNYLSSSSEGIVKLQKKEVDIARASRNIKPLEVDKFQRENRIIYTVHIAYDAIGIGVHPSKSKFIKSLDRQSIIEIFISGKIKNWKQLDPRLDSKMNVYVGEINSSGTTDVFLNWLNNKKKLKFGKHIINKHRTDLALNAIETDVNGITIVPLGMKESAYLVPLQTKSNEIVSCTKENVRLGKYPLSRDLNLIAEYPFKRNVANFFDYSLSDKGQKIIQDLGFIPVFSMEEE